MSNDQTPAADRGSECNDQLGPPPVGALTVGEEALLRAWADRYATKKVAAERERYSDLMLAVEWLLDDGHMNQEHLARLRAAFEAA